MKNLEKTLEKAKLQEAKIEQKVELTQEKIERLLDRLARSGLRDYLDYLSSARRIFLTNFFAGIARGLGFALGATVILSILIFFISHILSQIPIIGQFFQWFDQFLKESLAQGTYPRS